jgi:hypothetical protein
MTLPATDTDRLTSAIPLQITESKRRKYGEIAERQGLSRVEVMRRLLALGEAVYDREVSADRTATDKMADVLDELERRVHETFSPAARLSAWQDIGGWYVAKSTEDFRRLTGEDA